MTDTTAAWAALETAAQGARSRRIADMFAAEPGRLDELVLAAAGVRLDLSKQPWSLADLKTALALARAADVEGARAALFAGEPINASENRAVLHPALRAPDGSDFKAAGEPVSKGVEATRRAMRAFADAIGSGALKGATGKPFKAIVHIGIGGSDLGPRLIWEALRPAKPEIDLRFIANVDPADAALALVGLDPAETLVVVVSKTFTTQETISNALIVRDWLRTSLGEAGDAHLAAISSAPKETSAFGVKPDQVFSFGDWVGGRYSLWSPVGLSFAIALGFDAYEALLAGAWAMDQHFLAAPLEANAPVLLALAHVFNRNGLGRPVRAVVPYAQRLRLLPNFLQQLEMESNGKRVDGQGRPVKHGTAATVMGDAGTIGQHAFFQLLHQGSDIVPVDIIAVRQTLDGEPTAQTKLLANAVAQAEALMVGRSQAEVEAELAAKGTPPGAIATLAPQRTFPGDRPSSFLLLDKLDPQALGALLALYEHKTFVEGVLWEINSFDQWGVELGKVLAGKVLADLEGATIAPHDPSTTRLIEIIKAG